MSTIIVPAKRVHVPSVRDLALLAPGIRARGDELCARLRHAGHEPLLFETLRTQDRVWYLYGKGRTAAQCEAVGVPTSWAWPDCPDGVVTRAHQLASTVHAYGLAFDVICRRRLWNASAAFWGAVRDACAAVGLFWAGTWRTLPDRPHCQVVQWTAGPSAAARQALQAGTLPTLWAQLGVA